MFNLHRILEGNTAEGANKDSQTPPATISSKNDLDNILSETKLLITILPHQTNLKSFKQYVNDTTGNLNKLSNIINIDMSFNNFITDISNVWFIKTEINLTLGKIRDYNKDIQEYNILNNWFVNKIDNFKNQQQTLSTNIQFYQTQLQTLSTNIPGYQNQQTTLSNIIKNYKKQLVE